MWTSCKNTYRCYVYNAQRFLLIKVLFRWEAIVYFSPMQDSHDNYVRV